MSIHWLPKAMYIFGAVSLLVFAVLLYIVTHQILFSAVFGVFGLLNVYTIILSQATIDVDQNTITLFSPPRGTYKFYWRDLRYIETDRNTYAFFGDDKHLVVTLAFVGKRKREFYSFVQHLIKERRCEVRPLSSKLLMQKNTKIN